MNKTTNGFIVMLSAMFLSGCAVQNLGSQVLKSVFHTAPGPVVVPAQQRVNVGNNLALPPDLQLAVPGQTSEAYVPNVGTGEGAAHDIAVAKANEPPLPAPTAPSIFAEYNISLVDADGNPKSAQQLAKELKAAKLARKKALNPDYGTIKNIRNIFTDQ
jgi:hypothetical protein